MVAITGVKADEETINTLEVLKQACEDGDAVVALASKVSKIKVTKQGSNLSYFPPGITHFLLLSHLDLSGNTLTSIPFTIRNLTALQVLNLSGNELTALAPELGELHGLVELDVAKNQLLKLPDSICNLTNLQVLNAYSNKLSRLPDRIGQLTALQRLGLKSNNLQKLPDSSCQLQSLVELFITDNKLETFPEGFGKLTSLVKLQASFNSFTHIQAEVMALPRLEMIRVAVCDIASMPEGMLQTASPSLAWCSLGGNAVSENPSVPQQIPRVELSQLQLGELLGDGASGSVYLSEWNGQPVAVKVFRSDVSPDGRTEEEVAISCNVQHPNLVSVLAYSSEPRGLVMPLVSGQPLADKPTFKPLLRCRWPADWTISLSRFLRIASGVAAALEYLHSQHICHGDVYAHNVLADEAGNTTLCDFGASYCYPPSERFWQAMEVRAYGLFLQDMLDRLQEPADQPYVVSLRSLVHDCISTSPATRVTFADITAALSQF